MIKVIRLRSILYFVASLCVVVALLLAVGTTGAWQVYYGNSGRLVPIYCVDRQDKFVSITFDCAWGTDSTEEILKELKKEEVHATFFMVEFWAQKYPEFVKKIDAAGCEIGTHSSTHSYMSKLNVEEIRQELRTSSQAITDITNKKVELFRPPYGDYDNDLIKTASEEGLFTIQWDVDSLDWRDLSATDIATRVLTSVKSGSIILMHNNGLHTAQSLPIILSTLKSRGYTFVPVGDLIYRQNYTIDAMGVQRPVA